MPFSLLDFILHLQLPCVKYGAEMNETNYGRNMALQKDDLNCQTLIN